MRLASLILPALTAAGVASVLFAAPLDSPADGEDTLLIASLRVPVPSASGFEPCMCPICVGARLGPGQAPAASELGGIVGLA